MVPIRFFKSFFNIKSNNLMRLEMGIREICTIVTSARTRRGIRKFHGFTGILLAIFLAAASVASGQVVSNTEDSNSIKYFDQGWETEIRHQYYFTPQGSHLMPYDWFLAIEQSDNDQLFSERANLAKYGWLWAHEDSTAVNPDDLPIGFTKGVVDVRGTGKWMGWTCAACHTGEMVVNRQRYRVDGGSATADVGRFLTDLAKAVQANVLDANKFKRFAGRVLGSNQTQESIGTLQQHYQLYSATLAGRVAMRTSTFPGGPGRVDALGQIITAMSVFQLGIADNYQSPDAPVSYPFLWYTPKLAWVQWSPISSNPIGRNAGEVLGVFGHADFIRDERDAMEFAPTIAEQLSYSFLSQNSVPDELKQRDSARSGEGEKVEYGNRAQHGFFSSTVEFENLFHLEQWLNTLTQPKWNEAVFGPIDRNMGAKGAVLFKRNCRMCHNMPPFNMTPKEQNIAGKQFIKIGKVPYKVVGTDPTYIESLTGRFTNTGDLGPVLFDDETVVPAGWFFLGGVTAVVKRGLDDLALSDKEKLVYSGFRFFPPERSTLR